jgi:hypothetical protein
LQVAGIEAVEVLCLLVLLAPVSSPYRATASTEALPHPRRKGLLLSPGRQRRSFRLVRHHPSVFKLKLNHHHVFSGLSQLTFWAPFFPFFNFNYGTGILPNSGFVGTRIQLINSHALPQYKHEVELRKAAGCVMEVLSSWSDFPWPWPVVRIPWDTVSNATLTE